VEAVEHPGRVRQAGAQRTRVAAERIQRATSMPVRHWAGWTRTQPDNAVPLRPATTSTTAMGHQGLGRTSTTSVTNTVSWAALAAKNAVSSTPSAVTPTSRSGASISGLRRRIWLSGRPARGHGGALTFSGRSRAGAHPPAEGHHRLGVDGLRAGVHSPRRREARSVVMAWGRRPSGRAALPGLALWSAGLGVDGPTGRPGGSGQWDLKYRVCYPEAPPSSLGG
jgi:hypothetical protein